MDIARKKDTGEPGNGGQFGTDPRASSGITLPGGSFATEDIFGPPIHVYTVSDALSDGSMVRPHPDLAQEAGYRIPVVLTKAANRDLVAWDDDDPRLQDEEGRYWDVLNMMRGAVKSAVAAPGERQRARVLAVPRFTASGGRSLAQAPRMYEFDVVAQPLDRTGQPCLTILLPSED